MPECDIPRINTYVTAMALSVQVTHAFPAVLEKLDLPAFDMSKIISTFVRHLAPADQVWLLLSDPSVTCLPCSLPVQDE